MKTILLFLLMMIASNAYSEEWINYFSNKLVTAEYDKASKNDHTIIVRWTYKSPKDNTTEDFYYHFKAYCSTQQLFALSRDGSMREVQIPPETLYEKTWKLICGIH